MRIYGVTGRKNSGKTGLVERLVAEFTARGLRVSTIKHSHHDADVDRPGTDSHRHRSAGAHQVIFATPARWALMTEAPDGAAPLSRLIEQLDPVDLLLVEGFKTAPHPKIETFRAATATPPLAPENPTIRALASDSGDAGTGLASLHLDDTSAIADFILREVGLAPVDAGTGGAGVGGAGPRPGGDTPVASVLDSLRDLITPITGAEELPPDQAMGRVLAADAVAGRRIPPHDNSALDGYGFAHDSLPPGAAIPVFPGRSAAGQPFHGTLPAGKALRILTGATVPAGMDTVVADEVCTLRDGAIQIDPAPTRRGANIRHAGEDVELGAVVLRAGRKIGPAEIGLAIAAGTGPLQLRPRLRVGILSTGDELIDQATQSGDGTPDANRPMLMALVTRLGHVAVDLGIIRDDRAAIRAALEDAAGRCDILLTSGGASAGDEDHVSALLRGEGRLVIWRVAIRPGRPLTFADWRGLPVIGLPGNPVAAMICALVFALPALGQRAGGDWSTPAGFEVRAGFSRTKRAGRREYLRARLTPDGRAEVFPSDGSGRISGLVWADGLIELPDGVCEIRPGDGVRYLPFSAFGL